MAEVLITLGIIGVVAVLTLPSLIEKHQEQVTINKVKKFYSVMSQAQLWAIKDNGFMDEWDVPDGHSKESAEKLMSYLKPYLKIVKDCGASIGCAEYPKDVKFLDSKIGSTLNYAYRNDYYKMILADGTYMWLRASQGKYCAVDDNVKNSCGALWIDVNGKKPPNTLGRDVFLFKFTKNTLKAEPYRSDYERYGWCASSWILEHGNMDYLKKYSK